MVLITGGMGFIGLHTVRRFLDVGEDVVATRFRTVREPEFIQGEIGKRVKVEPLDLTAAHDVVDIVQKHKVDSIVHLAVPALGGLSAAEDFRVNMFGLINVLEAGRIGGVKRVSVASSGSIYTGMPGPFREDMLLPMIGRSPTESYKKAFEVLGQHYGDRTGMSVVILRITGIYGPLYHSMSNLPSRLCHAAAHGIAPNLAVRGGVPFEEDAQDLTYCKDCALGIQLVHSDAKQHTVYNIGGGRATSNGEMLAAARKLAAPGFVAEFQAGKGPSWRPEPYCDNTRAETEVGYKPQYDVDGAFKDYINWLKRFPN